MKEKDEGRRIFRFVKGLRKEGREVEVESEGKRRYTDVFFLLFSGTDVHFYFAFLFYFLYFFVSVPVVLVCLLPMP